MSLSAYLLRWIAASGGVALLVAALFIVVDSEREAAREHARAVDTARRLLMLQVTGPRQGAGFAQRFVDWSPVTLVSRPPGACLALIDAAGRVHRRTCSGRPGSLAPAPAAFATLYASLAARRGAWHRPLAGAGDGLAVMVYADHQVGAARAWLRMQEVLLPMSLVIGVICCVTWWAATHALRPLGDVVAALDRIGRGDYRARIATTGCTELARLGEGCERLAAALGAASAERTTLVRRLVAVQEQERAALALELHDEFGQHLSVIRANAAGMLSPGAGAGIAADVARIEGSAAHLMQLVRERLRALRPWSEHASLSDSLRELAADVGGGSGGTPVVLELDAPATLDAVPRPLALAVYRIVQESLTNAVRHAGASRITASVSCTESALLVVVSDDGRGYEPACRHRGAGMGGIEERTRACGGQVAFVRNDDGGLCVRAAFPWSATPPVGAP